MSSIIGWDVGGAHLKAALVRDGRGASQVDPAALRIVARPRPAGDRARCGDGHARHARRCMPSPRPASCRLFPNRHRGRGPHRRPPWRAVSAAGASPSMPGRAGSSRPSARSPFAEDIASANWHATAALVGEPRLPMRCSSISGRPPPTSCRSSPAAPPPRGFNDHDRLVAGELVYMGLTRTPVAAVADRVPFRGRWSTMMNEYFATMADVWRVLDVLPPDGSTSMPPPTAGRKDRVASMARLARMVGLDAGGGDEHDWLVLAAWLAEQQMRRIEDGIHLVQSALDLPRRRTGRRRRGRAVHRRAHCGAPEPPLHRFRDPDRGNSRTRRILGQHLRPGRRRSAAAGGSRGEPRLALSPRRWAAIRSISHSQASRSSGPAVLSMAICEIGDLARRSSRGGSMSSRLVRMAASSTAALARLSPPNGR